MVGANVGPDVGWLVCALFVGAIVGWEVSAFVDGKNEGLLLVRSIKIEGELVGLFVSTVSFELVAFPILIPIVLSATSAEQKFTFKQYETSVASPNIGLMFWRTICTSQSFAVVAQDSTIQSSFLCAVNLLTSCKVERTTLSFLEVVAFR